MAPVEINQSEIKSKQTKKDDRPKIELLKEAISVGIANLEDKDGG